MRIIHIIRKQAFNNSVNLGLLRLCLRISVDVIKKEENVEEITFIGLCTDICVISNVMLVKAFFPEIPLTVDAKACAGVTPESHRNALASMKTVQVKIINE